MNTTTTHLLTDSSAARAHFIAIDTKLADAHHAFDVADNERRGHVKVIARLHQDIASGISYRATYAADQLPAMEARLADARIAVTEANALIHELNAQYTGWTRFFIVRNSNGHVHSSTRCSSCNKMGRATDFGWLVDQAGKTEAEIIELAGEGACSVCFPSAPVTTRENQLMLPEVAAMRAERAAKAAANAAKAAAAGISNRDGSPLENGFGVIRTERSAQISAVDEIANRAWGYRSNEVQLVKLIDALAFKRGLSVEEVRADIEAKAAAKVKRESRMR